MLKFLDERGAAEGATSATVQAQLPEQMVILPGLKERPPVGYLVKKRPARPNECVAAPPDVCCRA